MRGLRYLVYNVGRGIRAGLPGPFWVPALDGLKEKGGQRGRKRSLSRNRWRRVHSGWIPEN